MIFIQDSLGPESILEPIKQPNTSRKTNLPPRETKLKYSVCFVGRAGSY